MYYFKAITLRALARMVGIVGSVLARVRSLRPVLGRRRRIGDARPPPPNTGGTIHFDDPHFFPPPREPSRIMPCMSFLKRARIAEKRRETRCECVKAII
jgi:hypothetical protein